MTPEDNKMLADYIASMAELEPSRVRIERSRARAKELREAKDSGVRSMGKFMAAPHPLEVMATLMQRQQGLQRQQQSDTDEDELLRKRIEAAKAYNQRVYDTQAAAKAPLPVDFGQDQTGADNGFLGMPFPGAGQQPGQPSMPGFKVPPPGGNPWELEDPYGFNGGLF